MLDTDCMSLDSWQGMGLWCPSRSARLGNTQNMPVQGAQGDNYKGEGRKCIFHGYYTNHNSSLLLCLKKKTEYQNKTFEFFSVKRNCIYNQSTLCSIFRNAVIMASKSNWLHLRKDTWLVKKDNKKGENRCIFNAFQQLWDYITCMSFRFVCKVREENSKFW